jgi:hypothetical protein
VIVLVLQALSLMKAHTHRPAVETAHGAHVVELEASNAKLQAELEQARLALPNLTLLKTHCR